MVLPPRRGTGIEPGALAPGKWPFPISRSPNGAQAGNVEDVSAYVPSGLWERRRVFHLALKRQALCLCPFGAIPPRCPHRGGESAFSIVTAYEESAVLRARGQGLIRA